jgi:hypothetical protein
MHGRRRETRFLPSAPWNAALQTTEDVSLEKTESGDVWVVSDAAARRGDAYVLEVATGGLRMDVRVLESEPVLVDGVVRHRVRLRVLDPEMIGFPGEPLSLREAPARAGERHGTENRSRY